MFGGWTRPNIFEDHPAANVESSAQKAPDLALCVMYRVARSRKRDRFAVPNLRQASFRKKALSLPQTGEAERLVVRRVGQETFRNSPNVVGERRFRAHRDQLIRPSCEPITSSLGLIGC